MALVATCLSCGDSTSPEAAGLGLVEVTVATEGGDLDLDGYIVVVGQAHETVIGVNETLVLRPLRARGHAIGLTDVADNCEVAGQNPRLVTVVPDATQSVNFDVDCHATGVLVTVEQSGDDLDDDGFTVTVRDGPPIAVQAGTPTLISRLTPGLQYVVIGDVADNCIVDGDTAHLVDVGDRTIEPVTFQVTCLPVAGFIEVVITTTGEDADLDGYRITLDGVFERLVSANDSIMVAAFIPGNYTIGLEEIASNCTALGGGTRLTTVQDGAIARVTFEVTCSHVEAIVFARGPDLTSSIWLARADGSGEQWLSAGTYPAWHPDGQRLAFLLQDCPYYPYDEFCSHTLVTMTLGSPPPSAVLPPPIATGPIDWSPDGSSIVLSSHQGDPRQLYIVGMSGAPAHSFEPIHIVGYPGLAEHPAWSPDGKRLAFTCRFDSQIDICLTNRDGSGFLRLTIHPASDSDPAWSPDGTQLAFVTDRGHLGVPAIAVMNVNGANFRVITDGTEPAWSPDGTRLVVRKLGDDAGLYLVNVDGFGVVRLTTDGSDHSPRWRP